MRRRLRRRYKRNEPKPVDAAWLTTSIIMVAAFLWYLLHLYGTTSFQCRDFMNWWFQREEIGMATLQWSSLLAVTVALWFNADIIRSKPVRVPFWIRFWQGVLVASMVIISVFQWGFYRPQSDEGRVYAYFTEHVDEWPILNLFFYSPQDRVRYTYVDDFGDLNPNDPLRIKLEALETDFAETFGRTPNAPWFGEIDGRMECEAIMQRRQAEETTGEILWKRWQAERLREMSSPESWADPDSPPEPDDAP